MSISFSRRSNASIPAIGRQRPGAMPPVKITGNGHETPASLPSMNNWTSLNGEPPCREPVVDAKVSVCDESKLEYQNSSAPCPHAESETTALLII